MQIWRTDFKENLFVTKFLNLQLWDLSMSQSIIEYMGIIYFSECYKRIDFLAHKLKEK